MSAARRTRLTITCGVVTAILVALVLVLNACTSSAAQPRATGSATGPASADPSASPSSSPTPSPTPTAPPLGTAGTYRVGEQQMTFAEPAHNGPTGAPVAPRTLVTTVQYPLAQGSASNPGPFPLILFAPGYQQCAAAYGDLLQTWASAGYVVAAVTFPQTNCQLGNTKADENDLVNQPQDMSFVLSSLLTLGAEPNNVLSGLINRQEIAAAGQSDGGDTVAALVANTCCADTRVKAAAVLSGAEWPAMPGRYFTSSTPPILFTQGNADSVNPPSASIALYRSDRAGLRYYLNLLGASHLSPYEASNPAERAVSRVTLAFFNQYVLNQPGALAAMSQAGNVGGAAALVSGGHVPRNAG